ncbi:hypothetical protein NFJ02_14g16990 [Pycnococcus provasolii]
MAQQRGMKGNGNNSAPSSSSSLTSDLVLSVLSSKVASLDNVQSSALASLARLRQEEALIREELASRNRGEDEGAHHMLVPTPALAPAPAPAADLFAANGTTLP